MCITCEKSKHNFHFARVQRHLRAYVHRATDVTKLGPVRSRNFLSCSCSHCGSIARELEHNLQTCVASVSNQCLRTAPRVCLGVGTCSRIIRRSLTQGGYEPAVHTSETFNRGVRASTAVLFTSSSALRCRWHRGVHGRPGLWHLQTCRHRVR